MLLLGDSSSMMTQYSFKKICQHVTQLIRGKRTLNSVSAGGRGGGAGPPAHEHTCQ